MTGRKALGFITLAIFASGLILLSAFMIQLGHRSGTRTVGHTHHPAWVETYHYQKGANTIHQALLWVGAPLIWILTVIIVLIVGEWIDKRRTW